MDHEIVESELLSQKTVKACPFDSGQGVLCRKLRDGCEDGEPDAWCYWIRCLGCAAEGPWAKTEGNALRLWNMRDGVMA